MDRSKRIIWMMGASLATMACVAGQSFAQQEDDQTADASDELRVATVTVTTRKVEENLQDAPLSVTAFGEAEIEAAGLTNIEDIALLTPGLTVAPLFGGGASTVVIRGQSTTIGEPNVGFFVDGVYQSSRAAMDALLAGNVERVEIAKGPQSALYGRNTFAGAVNYITKKPENELTGELQASVGDFGLREIRASVSAPLVEDMVYFRGAASHFARDGYFDNELTGEDLDTKETNVVSGSLELLPSSDLSIVARAAYESTSDGDDPLRFLVNNSAPANPTPAPLPLAFQLFAGEMPGFEDGFAVSPGGFDRENLSLSLSVDKDFANGFTLTSITGYTDLQLETDVDNDYEARSIRYSRTATDITEFSQEIRLASPADDRFSWMIGGYYYDLSSDTAISDTFVDGAFALATALAGSPLGRLLPGGAITTNDESTSSFAVFGAASFDITDQLSATFEGRWTTEDKDITATFQDPISLATLPDFVESTTFDNFVPKFTLDYHVNDDVLLYATVAKAVKTGGFNIDVTGAGILPSERTYDPENSWTYEAGFKSTLADGRMVLNGAVYQIEWTDQIVRALGGTFAVLNANAGESSVTGLELEMKARVADGLDFSAGYAYTDSSYDSYTFGALAGLGLDPVLDGTQLQYVSENQFNATLQYQRPAFGQWDFLARADYAFFSEQSTVQTADAVVGDTSLFNARVGIESDDMSIMFWAKNLFEEDTAVTGVFFPNQASRFDTANGLVSPAPVVGFEAFNGLVTSRDPRTWGVTVRKSF